MNTNTIKIATVTILAHLICLTVVLSHVHAKDAISLLKQPAGTTKLGSRDITAKALGDLHHHIDKAGLKNVIGDSGTTTAARTRSLNPLEVEESDDSLLSRLHDFMLRLRVVMSLCFQTV